MRKNRARVALFPHRRGACGRCGILSGIVLDVHRHQGLAWSASVCKSCIPDFITRLLPGDRSVPTMQPSC